MAPSGATRPWLSGWGSRRLEVKARHARGRKRKHIYCAQPVRPASIPARALISFIFHAHPRGRRSYPIAQMRKPRLRETSPRRPPGQLLLHSSGGGGARRDQAGLGPRSPSHAGDAEPSDARSSRGAFPCFSRGLGDEGLCPSGRRPPPPLVLVAFKTKKIAIRLQLGYAEFTRFLCHPLYKLFKHLLGTVPRLGSQETHSHRRGKMCAQRSTGEQMGVGGEGIRTEFRRRET